MFKQTAKLFFLLVCFYAFNIKAQISVTSTVVCLPSGITFSVSSGSSYSWNFGNSQTSTLQNPSVAYTTPGNYTVTCLVGGTTSYSIVIKVASKPTPAFSIAQPASGCAPKTVTVTSTSTGGGGSAIVGYNWVYGNGGSASTTTNSTTYAYPTAGSYSITLSVTDANGCSDNLTLGTVNVSAPPSVIIASNPSPLGACSAPYSAAFSGSNCLSGSPTGGALTYNWSFPGGNPASSSIQNPGTITYNVTGNYTASLTVTDNNNCSGSTAVNFSVNQPSLSITAPSTICLGSNFNVTANSNISQVFWNFGAAAPGSSLTLANVSSTVSPYFAPGIYTISATTIPAPGSTCTASSTKTVYVEQVTAQFTLTPPSMTCSPTMTVGFINQSSSNVVSWSWNAPYYVNGPATNTSNLPNPTFTVTQGSLNPYTIYPFSGVYVTLIVTTANGCKDTIMHIYDSIQRPTARFNRSVKEGCAPLTVTLRDTSTTYVGLYPIQSYTWISGITPASASTSLTGTVPPAIINPTFTYVNPGVYTPTLMIMTATGCYDIFVDTITVANPPNVSISFSPTTACWNTPVTVTMSATPATTPAPQHWHVDSDNGFFSGCVTNPIQTWNFTHVGVHTFTVSSYLHSCKGTNTSTASVTINGPIGRTRYETNCTNRKDVSFFSHLQDAQGAVLNFGDNSFVNITGTPGGIATHSIVHTYSASGNYTAILTSTNSITGCSPNTFSFVVKVRDAVANFTFPAVGCSSTAVTFDGSPSQDVLIACQRGYVWYVDNNPPDDNPSPLLTYTFATTGTHTVMLMVKDENSCADTTMKTIRISAAAPQFTFSQNPICSGGTVALVNNTPGTPDPISSWLWNFGDGTPTSTLQSPVHAYTGTSPSQTYTVSLTATNNQGCVGTQTQVITISNPIVFINPNPLTPCAGAPVVFTGPTGAGNTYTFNFGAGATSTLATTSNTASFVYPDAGNFTASITLQDANGCKNTAQTAVTVHSMTAADFTLSSASSTSTNNICSGAPVSYTATTQSTYPLNYQWSVATLNSSVVTNFIPASTSGTVAVTLTVSTSPLGCSAVAVKTFTVSKKPSANLNLNKNPICFGNPISINLKDSSSVAYWTYFFGDGTDITQNAGTSTQTVSHTYTAFPVSGNYPITVIYFSSGGACKDQATINVNLIKIDADFNRNNEIAVLDSNHCIGINDVFSNTTPGSAAYTFTWSFGDGNSATGQTSNHTYATAGVYQVTLNVNDPVNNCLGDAVKSITINPLPTVNILALDSICLNAPFVLNSSTSPNVVTYTWSPAANVTSPNSSSTTATSSVTPFTYSLGVTDANGCSNDTTKSIYVQMPPTAANWDTTVIIGQNIPMSGYAGTNFSYTWTPLTDLTCTNCIFPTSTSTVDITYTLVIEDGLGCFKTTSTYSIHVDPKATVDVPTAFTPNGDGTNDIIYVDGWGIKKLNYFRIFNRWGQLLFESNDIKVGWNGQFNSVPQNMETYIYQVSVETFVDKEPILKTGSFKLIR